MRQAPGDAVVLGTTATALVVGRNCILQGLVLTPAAASCTVALYDPAVPAYQPITAGTVTTTGATLRVVLQAAAAGGSVVLSPDSAGINFNNGCVAVVTGAGAQATVITGTI